MDAETSPLADMATLAGGLTAGLTLVTAARVLFNRTVGLRRVKYERLRRLGTGAQLSFFEAVLGEPPAIQRTFTDATGRDWPGHLYSAFTDRAHRVQVVSGPDGTVEAYAVTALASRFHPRFRLPRRSSRRPSLSRLRGARRARDAAGATGWGVWFDVKLGTTRFGALPLEPESIHVMHGRQYHYVETYFFGTSGYYLYYIFAAGTPRNDCFDHKAFASVSAGLPVGLVWQQSAGSPWSEWEAVHRFRRSSAVSTYAVATSSDLADGFALAAPARSLPELE